MSCPCHLGRNASCRTASCMYNVLHQNVKKLLSCSSFNCSVPTFISSPYCYNLLRNETHVYNGVDTWQHTENDRLYTLDHTRKRGCAVLVYYTDGSSRPKIYKRRGRVESAGCGIYGGPSFRMKLPVLQNSFKTSAEAELSAILYILFIAYQRKERDIVIRTDYKQAVHTYNRYLNLWQANPLQIWLTKHKRPVAYQQLYKLIFFYNNFVNVSTKTCIQMMQTASCIKNSGRNRVREWSQGPWQQLCG